MIKLATQLVVLLLCAKLHFGGIMVLIKIKQGLLEGEAVLNEYGGTFYSFKGIPYARPPIGDLRFKAPQPAMPWKDIRSAKEFGPVCPQSNFLLPNLGNMSEDCLYLNVYTPDTKPKQLLPVMVWIHGGGYIWGSGNDDLYGPQFLIRHGVILVTFNYRLEALGFLCLHTADVPGNAGMKDQVAALKWVKENIESFGGNPQNITIFGESAGASSVSYHLISPMSRGLFRRAITQSGAATCWWSQDFASRDKALLLAKQLGCFSEDDKIVYEFLKQQPFESLITLKLQVWKAQKPYEIFFAIANEKDFGQERFFYGDVTDLLRTDAYKGVEVLTGYTKDEWAMTMAFEYSLENMINDAKYFNDFFVPRWIKTHCVIADQLEVGRKMRQFYFKGGDVTEHGVIKFLSMDMFVYGIYVSAKFYSTKTTVYLYKLTCVSERNFMGRNLGLTELTQYNSLMCHADDLAYLFPLKDLTEKVDVKSDCFKSIETISKLWTNFAKHGNPTPDNSLGVYWRPFTLPTQEYLEFGNELTIKHSPEKEELEFWDSIFKEYVPNSVI